MKDRDRTAVFAVVFLNALMQAPITRPCLTYFWLRPAIVLFLPPLGHEGVNSNANELSPPLPPSWPLRPAGHSGPAAQGDAGSAARGWPGVSTVKPSAAPLERWLVRFDGLLEAVPPALPGSPKRRGVSPFLLHLPLPPEGSAQPPHGSLPRAGAAGSAAGLPSPQRYLCKRSNTANCRSV